MGVGRLGGRPGMGQMAQIITVAAAKGGVGKTTLAYELAFALGGVLVDLDWDAGGATRMWGYRAEDHRRAPLLDGLQDVRVPAPLHAPNRPALVPSHPDLAVNQPDATLLAEKLNHWAASWLVPYVVVDTHPGAMEPTFGALAAARVVVVPVVLRTRELDALEGMLKEFGDYPMLIVPNLVPSVVPEALIKRLGELTRPRGVPIAPPVSEYPWWGRRQIHAALTSYDPVPTRMARVVAELQAVATVVRQIAEGEPIPTPSNGSVGLPYSDSSTISENRPVEMRK